MLPRVLHNFVFDLDPSASWTGAGLVRGRVLEQKRAAQALPQPEDREKVHDVLERFRLAPERFQVQVQLAEVHAEAPARRGASPRTACSRGASS